MAKSWPGYSGQANFSHVSLQNAAKCLHEKQKVSPASRVTHMVGSPSFEGRVTFLPETTFLHINKTIFKM